jgi:predicted phosphodiesterase
MRIAILSDTHGNTIALDAVLADVERAGGVDAYWFVGDAVALGFDPVGTIKQLRALPGLKAVRGNTDRDTVRDADDIDSGFLTRTSQLPEQAPRTLAILRNFAWTRGALMAAGHLEWLASLPIEERVTLPDGTRVLLVHAAPGTDDGSGIREEQSDEDLAGILAGADADLVIVGHTHLPLERTVNGVRAWNLGSVSLPFTDEKRAMWTLLEADDAGYRLERRFAAYEADAVLARLDAISPPGEGVLRWALAKAD